MNAKRAIRRSKEDPRLLSIAKALSDGVPVDWKSAPGAGAEAPGILAELRFVQSVVDAHRRVLGAPEDRETRPRSKE